MYDEIIFSPDPRKPYRGSIQRENDREYSRISIQLGSNGTFGKDGSHAAILERREDGFYQLLLANLDEGHSEPWRVFSDTYNVNTVCDQVEQLFEDGHLQVHFVEGEEKAHTSRELTSSFALIHHKSKPLTARVDGFCIHRHQGCVGIQVGSTTGALLEGLVGDCGKDFFRDRLICVGFKDLPIFTK